MKVVLTGGGSGGHFYPLIAVAEKLRTQTKIINKELDLYYMADKPYEENLLENLSIKFIKIPAGKIRIYFSFQNIIDFFRILFAIPVCFFKLLFLYPDVVFSKGGYVAGPVLIAAKFLRIPVIIHESDSVPGRSNVWASKFALRIGVSFPEAAEYFPKERVAVTGQPVRDSLFLETTEEIPLDASVPTILVVGGSQGAERINNVILESLGSLLPICNVIHQAGDRNIEVTKTSADALLRGNEFAKRYHLYDFLNGETLSAAYKAASIVVTRAGSQLFEIAGWEIPAIVIPITESNGDHQRKNAYSYARNGAGVVIEESNLTPSILTGEVKRILESESIKEGMKEGARKFASRGAADTIASEIIRISISHERI